MKKQRQKQITIDAVVKVQNFLLNARKMIEADEKISFNDLTKFYRIDRMIGTLAVRNKYFNKGVVKGEYAIGENYDNSQTGAKKLIEMVRLSKIDSSLSRSASEISQNKAPQSKDNVVDDTSEVPKIKIPSRRDLSSIETFLSGRVPGPTLFTENEKEFEHKLQIACAIASGCYVQISEYVKNFDFEKANDYIVLAANDLYNKLKK